MALFDKKSQGMGNPNATPNDPFAMPPGQDPFGGMPPQDPMGGMGPPPGVAQGGYMQPPPQDMGMMGGGYDDSQSDEDTRGHIEEIAEAIIDEKWNDLMRDMNKVIEWKERSDTELKRLAQEIEHLKERFESLHKGVLGKISEYDQNLHSVGSEIKAMEMTFQKILPTFTENVNKLERLTKRVS